MRQRLIVLVVLGLPVAAGVIMLAGTSGRPALAQATDSPGELEALPAHTEPSDLVDLASSEKGVIEELTVEEGDTVKKGHVVCRLESSVEQGSLQISKTQAESEIDVEVAKLRHELKEIEQKRVLDLAKRSAAAPMEVETARIDELYTEALVKKAQHDRRVAQFEYERDKKVIERRTIKSPLDGYVAKRVKSVGELVDGIDDTVLCQIARLDPLHVRVPAPTSTYGRIRLGDRAIIRAGQLPDGRAEGKVILVDRLVQPESQMYTIKLEVPNPENKIPAGIKVAVTFP